MPQRADNASLLLSAEATGSAVPEAVEGASLLPSTAEVLHLRLPTRNWQLQFMQDAEHDQARLQRHLANPPQRVEDEDVDTARQETYLPSNATARPWLVRHPCHNLSLVLTPLQTREYAAGLTCRLSTKSQYGKPVSLI